MLFSIHSVLQGFLSVLRSGFLTGLLSGLLSMLQRYFQRRFQPYVVRFCRCFVLKSVFFSMLSRLLSVSSSLFCQCCGRYNFSAGLCLCVCVRCVLCFCQRYVR